MKICPVTPNITLWSLCPAQKTYLKLLQSEATSSPLLGAVAESGTAHNRLQLVGRPGGHLPGLLNTLLMPPDFPGRLVEPALNVFLPFLVEVPVWHHVIPFGRHGDTERERVGKNKLTRLMGLAKPTYCFHKINAMLNIW